MHRKTVYDSAEICCLLVFKNMCLFSLTFLTLSGSKSHYGMGQIIFFKYARGKWLNFCHCYGKNFHAILCGWLVVVVAIDLFLSA